MAGTPEKILEHLLEFMRLDATLYDPVGRWGPGIRVPARGPLLPVLSPLQELNQKSHFSHHKIPHPGWERGAAPEHLLPPLPRPRASLRRAAEKGEAGAGSQEMSPAGKKCELLSWRQPRPLGVESPPSAELSPSFQS